MTSENENPFHKLDEKGRANLAKKLEKKMKQRNADRGAPFYGAREKDFLSLKTQAQEMIGSLNNLVSEVNSIKDKLKKRDEEYSVLDQNNKALVDLLLSIGVFKKEDILSAIQNKQISNMNLKPIDSLKEDSVIFMTFEIFLEDTKEVIQSVLDEPIMYVMGSNGLVCEKGMIGMKVGEERLLDVRFGNNFSVERARNIDLKMRITADRIMQRKPASEQK